MTPKANLQTCSDAQRNISPLTDSAHLKDGKIPLGDPSDHHPNPFISGLSCLPFPLHNSCSLSNSLPVGETNEPWGRPIFQPAGSG